MNKSASAVHENFKFCSNLSPSAYKKAVILHHSPVQNDSLSLSKKTCRDFLACIKTALRL